MCVLLSLYYVCFTFIILCSLYSVYLNYAPQNLQTLFQTLLGARLKCDVLKVKSSYIIFKRERAF